MKNLVLVAIICLTFACASRVPGDIWSWCGTSSDHLKIGSVTITPDPPKIGQNVTIVASGTLDESLTQGSQMHLNVSWGGIQVVGEVLDFCTVLGQIAKQGCPVPAGPVKFDVTETIPKNVPPGTYSGVVVVDDQNSEQVTCIDFKFSLS